MRYTTRSSTHTAIFPLCQPSLFTSKADSV